MKRIILCLSIFIGLTADVNARDLGQWEAVDPKIREWYQPLMQPDVPNASCCGEADAYWADEVHVRDGKTYAVIRMTGPTNRAAGLTSTSERKSKSRTTNSTGTNRIQPVTASYS